MQFQAKKAKTINLTVSVPKNKKAVIDDVTLDKNAVSSIAKSKKAVNVTVKNPNGDNYTVKVTAKSAAKLNGKLNLGLDVSSVSSTTGKVKTNVTKALKKSKVATNKAQVVSFSDNKNLKASVQVTLNAKGIKGVKTGSKVYVYYYNSKTGKLSLVSKTPYKVSKKGTITFTTSKGGNFVMTTKKL